MATEKRFNVSIGQTMDNDIQSVANNLGITKAEVIRRAFILFKHASKAEKVLLQTPEGEQVVLIK